MARKHFMTKNIRSDVIYQISDLHNITARNGKMRDNGI